MLLALTSRQILRGLDGGSGASGDWPARNRIENVKGKARIFGLGVTSATSGQKNKHQANNVSHRGS